MYVCFDLRKIKIKRYHKPILTLGTFDGVHLGHRVILKKVRDKAKKHNTKSLVVTYEPHPQSIVSPKDAPMLLTSLEEKLDLLEELEIDETVVINFDEELANYSADRFIQEILIDKLDPQAVIIGYNHGFGKDRKGGIQSLKEEGRKKGFEVKVVSPVEYQNQPISSTRIRKSIISGKFNETLEMLGYGYSLYGKVMKGRGWGKKMGYPTANLEANSRKLLPKDGVYAAESVFNDKKLDGMMYIGSNPTFKDKGRSLEIHLFDFEGSIKVGQKIKLNLKDWFRGDVKFNNMESLRKQLQQDESRIKNHFKTN